MGDRSLTVSVAEETIAGLDRIARETGRSPDQLAGEALEQYVEYQSWKTEKIKQAIGAADADEFATDAEIDAAYDRYRHAVDRGE